MKLRTAALMLALAFGFGTMAEARTKSTVHKVKVKKPKRPKPPKAPKRAKVKHARHV